MISATSALQHQNHGGSLLSPATPSTSSSSSSSFTDQLANALQQYLGKANTGSNLEIDIQPSQSQNSGSSQFLVTVKSNVPSSTTAAPTAPAATTTPTTPQGFTASAGPIFVATGPIPGSISTANSKLKPADSTGDDGGATLTPVDPSQGSGSSNPAGSTGSTSASTPPPGWVNVPFGSGMTTMPSLSTELAENNRVNAMMAQINPASLNTSLAQAGDPDFGGSIPGSSLKWNDLTENQQLAYQYSTLAGLPQGQSMDQFLAANAGPSAWWNASYSSPNEFGAPPAAGSVNMYNNGYTPS